MAKKKRFGFSGIYDDLINELTFSWLWKVVTPAILILLTFSMSFNLGMLMTVEKITPDKFFNLAFALLMLFIVLAIVLGVIFGIFTNLAGINYRSATLSAKLAIAIPHPFKKSAGLSFEDLGHLKSIGLVEQSAAGWQGALLSFAVIWFLVENISLFTNPVNELIAISERAQNIQQFNINGLVWVFEWLLTLLVIGIIAFVVFKFIYNFLGNEPANRAIIKACEDAQAILDILELKDKQTLTIKDKQRVAKSCEYTYIAQNKLITSKHLVTFNVYEANNKNYALILSERLQEPLAKTKER